MDGGKLSSDVDFWFVGRACVGAKGDLAVGKFALLFLSLLLSLELQIHYSLVRAFTARLITDLASFKMRSLFCVPLYRK